MQARPDDLAVESDAIDADALLWASSPRLTRCREPVGRVLLEVAGVGRRYLVVEPSGTATDIVVSLHGTRSTPEGQARLSGLGELADTQGAVVAFPQALVSIGSGYEWVSARVICRSSPAWWTSSGASMRRPIAGLCVAGMSGGARMACRFAADRSLTWSAARRGGGRTTGSGAPTTLPPGPDHRLHGTADRINPYEGSGTGRWNESVPEAARGWALVNGLPDAPTETPVSASPRPRMTSGADGNPGQANLWTLQGAGHTWPGSLPRLLLRLLLGRTSHEIDATVEIGSFFTRWAGSS